MRLKINGTIKLIFFLTIFLSIPAIASAESFFVDENFDAQGRKSLEAKTEVISDKAYFFVEDAYLGILPGSEVSRLNNIIVNLSSEFDNVIYPKLRKTFGNENSPGIDGDAKITILLQNMQGGVGGYVRDADGYSGSIGANSNEREMIYINIKEVLNGELGPSYIAHEFQHLITFNQKTIVRGIAEEKWLNEARSEYAPTAAGYSEVWAGSYLKKRVGEFLSHPSDALLDWRARSVDHASVSLFIHYLVDRYGIEVLGEMMRADSAGTESIDAALVRLGHLEKFKDVFRDWILAIYVNSATDTDEERFKYGESNLSFGNLHVLPSGTFRMYGNYSSGANFIIDNWSGQWYRFVPGSLGEETTLHVNITSDFLENLSVPYIVNDFLGGTEVKFFDLKKGNVLSVPRFGNFVSSVVVVPNLLIGGTENISSVGSFSLEAFTSNSFVNRFREGALVRAEGDTKVYIIKNSSKTGTIFKRWIQTEEVFGFYNHFTWNDIIEVKQELLGDFSESFLIRKAGDYKIYEVDKFGRKKWLNMTASEFEVSGRSWDAVYEVNEKELGWFDAGLT